MVRRAISCVAAVFAVAICGSHPAHAQVLNGGFETPGAPAGGFPDFNSGSTIGAWTVVGAGSVSVVSNSFTGGGFNLQAHSGDNWLDLTGESNSMTGVSQLVSTQGGQNYSLTFWIGNVFNPGGAFGVSSSVALFLNGNRVIPDFVNAAADNSTGNNWRQYSFNFLAESNGTSIAFYNEDPSNDTANGLDDVGLTVDDADTTAPEPASMVLMATGMAAVGAAVRRKKR